MTILSIKNLSKSYGSNLALNSFCADFVPGIYALLGPNGAGKSTLMNLITDNLKADQGEITLQCDEKPFQNVLKMGEAYREKLGFMPQYPDMTPNFTVECFLWYTASLKDIGAHLKGKEKKKLIASQIDEVLRAVELDDVRGRKIKALSGGMKQRLALAQAVLGDPKILILDEPTAGLDPKQRIAIRNYISQLALDKIIIIATHVVSDIEYIANKVIILKKGVIVDCDTPAALIKKMEGSVWNLPVEADELDQTQKRFLVTNLAHDEKSGKAMLRVLSNVRPSNAAEQVTPTLEDYYLSIFGKSAKEE